jgi:hypothetical protein
METYKPLIGQVSFKSVGGTQVKLNALENLCEQTSSTSIGRDPKGKSEPCQLKLKFMVQRPLKKPETVAETVVYHVSTPLLPRRAAAKTLPQVPLPQKSKSAPEDKPKPAARATLQTTYILHDWEYEGFMTPEDMTGLIGMVKAVELSLRRAGSELPPELVRQRERLQEKLDKFTSDVENNVLSTDQLLEIMNRQIAINNEKLKEFPPDSPEAKSLKNRTAAIESALSPPDDEEGED